MLKVKEILNRVVSNIDNSIKIFIENNKEVLKHISLWDGYFATDTSLSVKAFGGKEENTGIYRIYAKAEENQKDFAKKVYLAIQNNPTTTNRNYCDIIIYPNLNYEIHDCSVVKEDEITLLKSYCTLAKITDVLRQADLTKIVNTNTDENNDFAYKQRMSILFTENSIKKVYHVKNNSNPGHWAHGDLYYTFIYDNKYIIDMEAYDDEAYCRERSSQIRCMSFFHIYDINGKFLYSASGQDFINIRCSRTYNSITEKIDIDKLLKNILK